MELTPRDRLAAYHRGPKIRDGIGFIAKPPEPQAPAPKTDKLVEAQLQIAQSYWGWAQALKTSQD